MPDRKPATTKARKSEKVWTDEERAAMQEAARERKAASRRGGSNARAEGEAEVLAKIAEMPEPDRSMGKRIHAVVTGAAPELAPRTWYGMPAYAKDGKVLCFFTPASKFKERYSTFGFNAVANLDEGTMWPTSWAITDLTADDEKRIAALVKQAVG